MITRETMRDWATYANALSNEEIAELIAEFSKIQTNRADELRRTAADKVIQAISAYLDLGGRISICGMVYSDDGVYIEVDTTFDTYKNHDGYLTFNFIQ